MLSLLKINPNGGVIYDNDKVIPFYGGTISQNTINDFKNRVQREKNEIIINIGETLTTITKGKKNSFIDWFQTIEGYHIKYFIHNELLPNIVEEIIKFSQDPNYGINGFLDLLESSVDYPVLIEGKDLDCIVFFEQLFSSIYDFNGKIVGIYLRDDKSKKSNIHTFNTDKTKCEY